MYGVTLSAYAQSYGVTLPMLVWCSIRPRKVYMTISSRLRGARTTRPVRNIRSSACFESDEASKVCRKGARLFTGLLTFLTEDWRDLRSHWSCLAIPLPSIVMYRSSTMACLHSFASAAFTALSETQVFFSHCCYCFSCSLRHF